MVLTPEMATWLTNSRETYEFYLLHSILHDPLRRSTMLAVPVNPDDFAKEVYELAMAAIVTAHKVTRAMGIKFPDVPTPGFMQSYVESACRTAGADRDDTADTLALMVELCDPKYKEQWYCVPHYFEAWYGSVQGKRIARKIQMADIPDMAAAVTQVQRSMAAASSAVSFDEIDEMDEVTDGATFEMIQRRSTGIEGLDLCLNGGWGPGECYLAFGGTGAGKSLMTGQCAWHEALTGGYPLIVSTELRAREYISRMVSCAASIPINLVQDCGNFVQIRSAVASAAGLAFREKAVSEVLSKIKSRVRIHKVSADDGMDARSLLDREIEKYHAKMGVYPTWVALDWLGSMADVGGGGRGTSERAMAWEISANGCVQFADKSGIPTLVLAQAVNDAQLKRVLSLPDIGISKGIGKNMVMVVGITNTMDMAGVKEATMGRAEMPSSMFLEDQFYCVCKARKGEGAHIPVRRDFRFQRFVARPRT
jgi:hypothetical protein